VTAPAAAPDRKLGVKLILDELFDLSLYTALRDVSTGDVQKTLDELIAIETTHFNFWQDFFQLRITRLDPGRRLKLWLLHLACRLWGPLAVQLVLEAIEVYGVRKYLSLWDAYQGGPLGEAVRGILEDELKHEDRVVSELTARKINPQRIRDIFLGMNDGLVEILGAVSGFFGAFGNPAMVLIAASTTAVAGSLSMAAGAYVASSSEQEVARTERRRARFLGTEASGVATADRAWVSALFVGVSYFAGALVPVLPVLLGAPSALASLVAAGAMIMAVSLVLAFLSGMDVRRRVLTNLVIIAAAVGVTYGIGVLVQTIWGISL
jgi:VIT1/CCC1 family predicted Fe2+/Mn2+ transporter